MSAALCVLTLASVGIASQRSADSGQAFDAARIALERGGYTEAVTIATGLVAAVERESGRDSLDLARAQDLLVSGLVSAGRAAESSTLALAENAVRLKERLAAGDLDTATSVHHLGAVLDQRGEFLAALALHNRALTIRQRQLPDADPLIADSLERQAQTLMSLERFDEARRNLGRARTIREKLADREPLGLAHLLELTVWLHRYTGSYRDAVPLLDRALEIRRKLSPRHPDMALLQEVRGDILFLQGNLAGAQASWSDALALGTRTFGPEHPAIAAFERKLAVIAKAEGDLADARQRLDHGLRIADRSLAQCNPETTSVMNDLASVMVYGGEFGDAYKLSQRALGIREKCLGPNHSLTATVVYNLSQLAVRMGDLGEAQRLLQRAIRSWSVGLRPDHPYVARGLDALGGVLTGRKDYVRARETYRRALAIRRSELGPDNAQVALTLTHIAQLEEGLGGFAAARANVDQAVAIYQRVGLRDEPDQVSYALELRAKIESGQGQQEAARRSLEEALATRERVFGRIHPLTAETRAALAVADFGLEKDGQALTAALEAEQAGRDQLRFTARYLPERQALTYSDKRPKGLALALSVAVAGRTSELPAVLDSVVQSRAMILDELAARTRSAVGSDPELGLLNATLIAARQRYANLMLRSVAEGEAVPMTTLENARRQKEDAERALAERSTVVRSELAQAKIGLTEVRRALAPGAALVSIVRYDRTSFMKAPAGGAIARTTPSYVAFVLRPGDEPVAIAPLGSAVSIDALVGRWRHETTAILQASSQAEAEKSYRAAGAALRQRVWDPLRAALKDASIVFVVPDGTLNLVSLAALPVGQSRFLIEQGPVIHYLSAERDLAATQPARASTGLLAVGGAAFDDASSFTRATRRATTEGPANRLRQSYGGQEAGPHVQQLRAACGSLQSLQFQPLEGTRREAREIASLWTDSPAQILESGDANERAFKKAAPGHRVLHLATHGFFLGSDCPPAAAGTRSIGGLSTAAKGGPKLELGEGPLLLSGLAFAGANRRAIAGPDDEDGILTAEEVTALNLEGVEWAVLSACDTGLGEVKAGEGVFGLRRAFQIAGVRTVIMSLWPVDDQAARLWMRTLYERRLKRQLSTAEAMREASLSVLRDRRARGQTTHPFYWAAFVATGAWQ